MKLSHVLASLTFAFSAGPVAADSAKAPARIDIAVTTSGFTPDGISVQAKQPVTLVFTRKTDRGCTKSVVVDTGEKKIEKPLPLNVAVEIPVTFTKAGKLTYACAMDMVKGTITVQ
jgi:plastocyanin domain-containing protein